VGAIKKYDFEVQKVLSSNAERCWRKRGRQPRVCLSAANILVSQRRNRDASHAVGQVRSALELRTKSEVTLLIAPNKAGKLCLA
jgi:hypothetical protein